MDASLHKRAEELAQEMTGEVRTAEDLSRMMQLMTQQIVERVLEAEMDVHLGRAAGEAVWPIVYFDGIVVHVRGANSDAFLQFDHHLPVWNYTVVPTT